MRVARKRQQRRAPTASRCVFDDMLAPAGLRAEGCRRRVSRLFDTGFHSKSISEAADHLPALGGTINMSTSTLSLRPLRLKWPVILNYGIACVTPALAVVLDASFSRLWGIDPPASMFLCGILIVAWVSGPGPALLATALTVVAFDYFLMQPIYSFTLEFREVPRLVLLTVGALFVVSLSATQ